MTNEGIRPTRFDMITNQMMKGCNKKGRQGNTAGTPEEIEDFKRVYGNTIRYLEAKIPKTVSVGVAGAMGKAILWYGQKDMEKFVEAFINKEFHGRADPCHALWEWLIRNNKRNTNEIYRRTVAAIRIYLRDGKVNSHLKPALDDIFEWSRNYRTMLQPKRNQHTNTSPRSPVKQTDEAIQADLEDTLSGCRT